MDKNNLRKEYLSIRNNVENKREKSEKIALKVIKEKDYIKAKTIAIYKSMENEVDTSQIIINAIMSGKTVALPRVEGDELVFYKYSIHNKLIKSEFGVLEPEPIEENKISKEKIDLCIVPGVVFDKDNNRIGYGKGFYDRFLNHTKMKKMGICFEEQISNETINANIQDVKMNKVIF